tara:strand:- start:2970 stop:3638 length:669 start_codon:yes stop_codon:yes gene_type:complete
MNDIRIETKFLINNSSRQRYIDIIKSLPFRIKKKYELRKINNIYLDTFNNHSLLNHLDGLNKRYKCRIRWYGNFENFSKPKLEFKIKKNQIITKKNFELPNSSLKNFFSKKSNLIDLIINFSKKNNFINFSKNLKISRIVCYERDYYESSDYGIRFTIDRNMQYKNWKKDTITIDSSRKILQKNFNIIEVKHSYESKSLLPIIIKNFKLRPQSYSKFVDYRY